MRRKFFYFKKISGKSEGFTLIEILVVITIITLIGGYMFANFSRTRLDLNQASSVVEAGIRKAQTEAVSSSKFNGNLVCGYGIKYDNSSAFSIFAGQMAAPPANCASLSKNFSEGDGIVESVVISNSKVGFKNAFNDIFFEPPTPTVYINNIPTQTGTEGIIIGLKDETCNSSNCQTICVYGSGRIETKKGSVACN